MSDPLTSPIQGDQETEHIGDFFTDRMWSPPGARLHVLLALSVDGGMDSVPVRLARMCEPALEQWKDSLRFVRNEHLHITLGWVKEPVAADLTWEQRNRVAFELAARIEPLPPIPALRAIPGLPNYDGLPALSRISELELTGPRLYPYGVRFGLVDPEGLVPLYANAAHQALAAVFGPDAVAPPAREPHVALAYGTGGDVTGITEALAARPLNGMKLGKIRLITTDTDTFTTGEQRRDNTVDSYL